MRLWERRDKLAADSNEKAWLMRVAVNLAISHRRGFMVSLRHRVAAPSSPDPAAVAITRLEGDKVRKVLLTLHPRGRAVLALRYGREMSFAEVGIILGQSEGTVRTSCHRAVQKLRLRLSDWVFDKSVEAHEDPSLVVKT